MIKKIFTAALIVSSTFMAYAETPQTYTKNETATSPYYFDVRLGSSLQEVTYNGTKLTKNTPSVTLNFGVDRFRWAETENFFRAEISIELRDDITKDLDTIYSASNTAYTGKMTSSSSSIMANYYFDMHNSSPVTPYIMVGAGLKIVPFSVEDYYTDSQYIYSLKGSNSVGFAWNVGAGISVDINPNWVIDIGAKYLGTSSYKLTSTDANREYKLEKISSIDVLAGIRYYF